MSEPYCEITDTAHHSHLHARIKELEAELAEARAALKHYVSGGELDAFLELRKAQTRLNTLEAAVRAETRKYGAVWMPDGNVACNGVHIGHSLCEVLLTPPTGDAE